MKSYSIKELLEKQPVGDSVEVNGWVKTFRSNRFIALNDGSTIHNLQCVVDFENLDEALLKQISTGAALKVSGELVESQGKGQSVEIQATDVFVHGTADPETYPIQPKKHSLEFLREKAHLRVRTNTFAAVMRVRSALAFAIHSYFQQNGFYYMHAPIITGSDAEGAGEMFRVSTLDPKNPPVDENGEVDYSEDFFGKETNLTVSGQLEAETY
ncbi:MAG: asparagine--tRNA ligase, partial [Muricauda sp.]|nr:asparagine--tRNA ligase [Allomuricauda sp.]